MKDRTILAIKGLAIIGVAFHHIANRRLDPHATEWLKVLIVLFDWCVLAFFCISGYLQALSDSKKVRSIWEFTQVRFNRLLVPYILLILFYSCIWQMVQAFHIPNIGVKIPADFIGKLRDSLWPVDNQVAQQLYFFPVLFAVSFLLVIIQSRLGLLGMWAAALITSGIGLKFFPDSFTGFTLGVFVWAIFFYAAGYLFFHYRTKKTSLRFALLAFTLLLIIFNGYPGLVRSVPLWLLAEGALIRLDHAPLLGRLGDASGTIYIYHTPFIIQPLAIAATYLHGPLAQFIGCLFAAFIAIGVCYLLFELLKNTRAKILLM
jgi:acyltransferase